MNKLINTCQIFKAINIWYLYVCTIHTYIQHHTHTCEHTHSLKDGGRLIQDIHMRPTEGKPGASHNNESFDRGNYSDKSHVHLLIIIAVGLG